MAIHHKQHDNSQSSLFEKLPPDLRRQIDIAVIERVPPTYSAVWMQFKLAEQGVSFTAFYRYARRLRDRANVAELANLKADDDTDIDAAIRKLVNRQVLENLLNIDDLAPKEIAALTTSHHHVSRTSLQERTAAEDSRLAWARLDHDRAELRLKSDHLQAIRQRFLTTAGDSNGNLATPLTVPGNARTLEPSIGRTLEPLNP